MEEKIKSKESPSSGYSFPCCVILDNETLLEHPLYHTRTLHTPMNCSHDNNDDVVSGGGITQRKQKRTCRTFLAEKEETREYLNPSLPPTPLHMVRPALYGNGHILWLWVAVGLSLVWSTRRKNVQNVNNGTVLSQISFNCAHVNQMELLWDHLLPPPHLLLLLSACGDTEWHSRRIGRRTRKLSCGSIE